MKNTNKFVERHNQLEKHPVICSLDVHTSNIYMYALNCSTGEILADCNILGGFKAVVKHLEKHQFSKKQTIILYEAGTFGFFPYRMFTKRGYSCKIIAPNSIPRKKNLKKTDRYDAIENANYHVSGNLRYVHIPSEQDEQARELLRYRFEQVWKITKQKQYIQAFLKRYGQVFEEGKSYWSKKHYRWLETIELPLITRRYLDLKLHDLGQLEKQLKTIETMLDDIFASDDRYQSMSKIYSLIPGVGKINAMVLVLEGGDLKRFKKPTALMSYTGLVPGKYASGTSDPHLRITKTGNKYLRTSMVGIAKMYRDRRTLKGNKEIDQMAEPIKSYLHKMQNRLNSRYRYLVSRGKNSNKARCAIARELCGYVWELVVKIEPKLNQDQLKLVA